MTNQPRLFAKPPIRPCRFYLGTHEAHWLGLWPVRLFISRRRLAKRKTFPRALAPWSLDSGGFTEVGMKGGWTLPARDYAAEVRRYAAEVGRMEWAAIQDWMCEPVVLAKTGKSLREHQRLTIASYLDLRDAAPDVPWIPVLQGWAEDDYLRHVDDYTAAGVDLLTADTVGVGSVCRRQGTVEIARLLGTLSATGLRLHGFGVKIAGLERASHRLVSADSMAWSSAARHAAPMDGHTHKSCANCMTFAAGWRDRVLTIEGVE